VNFLPLKLRAALAAKEHAGATKSLKFDELHSNSSANNPKSDRLLVNQAAFVAIRYRYKF
jgi:hypothetical protein